jgi:hypothetical protein
VTISRLKENEYSMIKVIKKARAVNFPMQDRIAKVLDNHLALDTISYESTDAEELTGTASMAYGFISNERINLLKKDLLNKVGWELRILDFYPRGYELLDHTHHTVSVFLVKEGDKAKLWRECTPEQRHKLLAFYAIQFNRTPDHAYGYFLGLVERYLKYGGEIDLWDLESQRTWKLIEDQWAKCRE